MVAMGPQHLAVAATLHAACFDEAWSAAAIGGILATAGSFGLLAVAADGTPVGLALCRVVHEQADVLAIGVAPAARRRGVGRALLDAAVAGCRARGARAVLLEVAEDNACARALYRAAGFEEVARRPGYYRRPGAPPVDARLMRLGDAD